MAATARPTCRRDSVVTMKGTKAFVAFSAFALALLVQSGTAQDDDFYYGTFPDGFLWGTATSSYQIEGGWNADGKGENIWDRFSHEGGNVANNDTGDVACDSYNKYLDDVAAMKNMGVKFYRFSLSWARIIPTGEANSPINQPGIDYYNNLINALIDEDIVPMITLYHWDLPQALQDKGGWENEDLIEDFTYYADIAFQSFGDRVKWWLTFNEPWVVTCVGYGYGAHAPGLEKIGDGIYTAAHTILKSHAEAYHLYDETYRPEQQGRIAITLDSDWKEPEDDSPENVEAALRAMDFKLGWYAHPIFVNGDYPQRMKDHIAKKNIQYNITEDRLPVFTEAEKARIVGTHDYFGLNHYTTQLIENCESSYGPHYNDDQDTCERQDESWPSTGSVWLKVVPWGLRKLLNHIKENYGDPEIIITENGVSDNDAPIEDDARVDYYRQYINNALKATDIDGVDLIGYTAWSLMDNFEWGSGYDEKFGLHYIDFDNPDRPRVPKKSAREYTKIISDNGFPEEENPSDAAGHVTAGWSTLLLSVAAALFFAWRQ